MIKVILQSFSFVTCLIDHVHQHEFQEIQNNRYLLAFCWNGKMAMQSR